MCDIASVLTLGGGFLCGAGEEALIHALLRFLCAIME
jgi:hypothetical protein